MLEAAFSVDGATWTSADHPICLGGSQIGLIASSAIPEVATAVRFEILSL